jgi:hypothetical protein
MEEAILQAALQAPSGDNSQPWKLLIADDQIKLINLPGRDTSLYNYRQRASLVAHGALIENILITSSSLGYRATVRTFPDKSSPDLVAAIALDKSEAADEPLYPFISRRGTNRKPYDSTPLTAEEKSGLFDAAGAVPGGKLKLTDNPEKKRLLAGALGINDRLVFENPDLHTFLFDHIRWTEKEAAETGDGLDIRTLELAVPQALGFRLLKNWNLLRQLNKLGISKFIAKQAEGLCLSSSAIGAVIMDENTDEAFINGGRLMQRVWLEATRLGLSLQPTTGIAFLLQRVLAGEKEGLSAAQIGLIQDAYERIGSAFALGAGETVVMLFRTGHSRPPGARSRRLALDKVVERR